MRVTQSSMYNTMTSNMQNTLANYMMTMEQGSTQKRVNRPSDDPAAAYRILTTRNSIDLTDQFLENINNAKGWLQLTDDVLGSQLTTTIRSLKELAEQGSTGTYDAKDREAMALQVRELLGQLLNLSNTEFNGNSIFAGHKYDKNAYEQGLATSSKDKNWTEAVNNGQITVSGSSDSCIAIQFTSDGKVGDGQPITYRWSKDGGKTWEEGTLAPGETEITLGNTGVKVNMPAGLEITGAKDTESPSTEDGTFVYVKPTGVYQGDTGTPPPEMSITGPNTDKNLKANAAGTFAGNVLVRFPDEVDLSTTGTEFTYQYSTDNGTTWITAKGKTTGKQPLQLPVPGGYVDIDARNATTPGANKIGADTQIMIHPRRADLGYEIMSGTYVDVNNVGKDIFGGYYNGKPALSPEEDIFNIAGDLLAALEFNNQEGCQEALAKLETALKHVTTEAARIGGLENRVELAYNVQMTTRLSQEEVLSMTEDVDLTTLLTNLTRYQTTYQTVLMSSSMIMNMSLAQYL